MKPNILDQNNQAAAHHHGQYTINIADGGLRFHQIAISDPLPLGRQILEASGFTPVENYSLFAILPSGDFEDLRLDETFDLQKHGAERFIAFQSDRNFKFTVKNHQLEWGKPVISGQELHKLANPPEGEVVFLEVPGGEDRLIECEELVDLSEPGIERFITAPKPKIQIIVNTRPRFVEEKYLTFEQVVELAFPGPHDPNVVFSMTYSRAVSIPHNGELGPGGRVKIKKGTSFHVTRTIKS